MKRLLINLLSPRAFGMLSPRAFGMLSPRVFGMLSPRALGMLLILSLLLVTGCTSDSQSPVNVPTFDLGLQVGTSNDPQAVSSGLQILLLLSVLSLAPALLVMVTAFTRIIIVLSFVRNALAVPQVPPNQVIIGLSLFLTFFVMAPTWNQVNQEALQPYLNGEIDQRTAYEQAIVPVREFLFRQTRERDLALFVHLADLPRPETRDDVPTYVLIPAFIISELKTSFQMGVIIFVPFLVIDMVVASALMSMGMMMLPPSLISLPFKLLLFVMVDGWHLVVRSLVSSFGSG
jgi:flagellar biosynthetic protein FliP